MPKLIGKAQRVVNVDGVLSIDEYVGNVGSQSDDLSIAVVQIRQPTAEPWLTLDYDEWMVVIKGSLEIHTMAEDKATTNVLTVPEGETVFIAKGERFRPVFPHAGAMYVPVCIPAFRPDRCLREDEEGVDTSDVAEHLVKLHSQGTASSLSTTKTTTTIKTVYHMCQQTLWNQAVASGKAYFPPTFRKDGYFTHATAVPSRLLETANHFYTASVGDWICLELSTDKLQDAGIMTLLEGPKPVGDQAVEEHWKTEQWACPHIYGGIPTREDSGVVLRTYPMKRDEQGKFLHVVGLSDV